MRFAYIIQHEYGHSTSDKRAIVLEPPALDVDVDANLAAVLALAHHHQRAKNPEAALFYMKIYRKWGGRTHDADSS